MINIPYNEFFLNKRVLVKTAIKILRKNNPKLNEEITFLEKNQITNYPYENLISDNDLLLIKDERVNTDCFGRPYKNTIIELKNKELDIDPRLIAGPHEATLYKTTLEKQLTIMGELVDENNNQPDKITAFALTEPEVVDDLKYYFTLHYKPKCLFIQSNYTTLRPFFPIHDYIFTRETAGYLLTLREYLSTNNKKLGDKLLRGWPRKLDKDMIKLLRRYN